jgi:vacuolar protein sorting-associated protein VTA1
METVNIPSENVPVELKTCEQILKRAKELKKAEPVVAYWCTSRYLVRTSTAVLITSGCFSAAQKALKMQNRSAEGTRFLMSLLDTLESVSLSCPFLMF